MKNKINLMAIFLVFILIFNILSPFNTVSAASVASIEQTLDVDKDFQYYLTQLLLNIGNSIYKLMGKVTKQEVTIDKIIFGEVDAVNANFFENTSSNIGNKFNRTIKKSINTWYGNFRNIAILVYLVAVVGVAIKFLLEGTPISKARGKDVALKWLTGVLLLFLFPYVIKYAFKINNILLNQIKNTLSGRNALEMNIGGVGDYSDIEVEYRSPVYVSKYTGLINSLGESERNTLYLTSVEEYKSSGDVMKLMYSYARITGSLIYFALWIILVWQTVVLLIMYYKRLFVIALLIMVFPIVTIFYVLDVVVGRSPQAFSRWCVEFFSNLFTQSIHAISYGLSAGVVIGAIRNQVGGSISNMNVVLIIISISFIFKTEGIIRKIVGGDRASSSSSMEEQSKATTGGAKKLKQNASRVKGAVTRNK